MDRPALTFPILALLTDRTILSPNWTLAQAVAPAVTGGANLVILRETDLPRAPRLTVARFVRDGVRSRVPFLLAGEPSLAAEAGADGVHLVDGSRDVAAARAALNGGIVGTTVDSVAGFLSAQRRAADYALVEIAWSVLHDRESGLALVSDLAAVAPGFPLVVGVDVPLDAVSDCMAAGAAGVAVCGPGMAAYKRTHAFQEYRGSLA